MASVVVADSAPASVNAYTVGWVAPLPFERAASIAMLDERLSAPADFEQNRTDHNQYTWGRIGKHHVVIASLPAGEQGPSVAATTATSMLSSLPSVRVGLLVGVASGVPDPDNGYDIRLGDVVVSQPQGASGGVLQYDLAKAGENGLEPMGMLNMPPTALRTALAELQSEHLMEPSAMPDILKAMQQRHPQMAKSTVSKPGFVHQGVDRDRFFEDDGSVRSRTPRDSLDPEIHYGTIASGSIQVEDVNARTSILGRLQHSSLEHIICIDKEAAGLMNSFPCLVVRGICDYANGTDNAAWQKYAAATAAAFTKELLSVLNPQAVHSTPKLCELQHMIEAVHGAVCDLHQDYRESAVMRWLAPADAVSNYNKASLQHHKGTGDWFISGQPYHDWKDKGGSPLWLYGKPGCGKTILSSTIIRDLRSKDSIVIFFYFDFTDMSKQSFTDMIRALIAQTYHQCAESQSYLEKLYNNCGRGSTEPQDAALVATLDSMLTASISDIVIVLDALDECTARKQLLPWLATRGAMRRPPAILLTSRKEHDIDGALRSWMPDNALVSIGETSIDQDILSVVKSRLTEHVGFERWRSQPEVLEYMQTELMRKACGMFRWAVCQLDILEDCLDFPSLEAALASLPKDLNATYERILSNIPHAHRPQAARLLQFLTYSERPLRLEEAVDVVAIHLDRSPTFCQRYRMPRPEEIVRLCSSLTELAVVTREYRYGQAQTTSTVLRLAHMSVKEYFTSGACKGLFQADLTELQARSCIVNVSLSYLRAGSSARERDPLELPLARFSAEYWMNHARYVQNQAVVPKSVLDLFDNENVYKYWLRLFDPDIPSSSGGRPPDRIDPSCMLRDACQGGLSGVAIHLIEKGVDVNAETWFGSPLDAAIRANHEAIVRLLLEKGAALSRNTLHVASRKGYEPVVRLLLEKGVDVNMQDPHGHSPLVLASKEGHESVVGLLLEKGADVNARDTHGVDALRTASQLGHAPVVRILLENGANVRAQYGHGRTALFAASENGHESVASLLLKHKAEVNARDLQGRTALYFASEEGHEPVVHVLAEWGANVNCPANDGRTALFLASRNNHISSVQALLEKRADVNAQSKSGLSSLHAAAEKGHESLVRLLLEHGADVDAHDQNGCTALHVASEEGHEPIALLLLGHGADINRQSSDGRTALLVAYRNDHYSLVQALLEEGANVNAQDTAGLSVLHIASEKGHESLVRVLLNYGASIFVQTTNLETALWLCSKEGHTSVVRVLLDVGADVDDQDIAGRSVLCIASRYGHDSTARLLMKRGADVNIRCKSGQSALYVASQYGHSLVAGLLLEAGANIHIRERSGTDALWIACASGHDNICRLLIAKGATGDAKNHGRDALVTALENYRYSTFKVLVEGLADVHERALAIASRRGTESLVRWLLGREDYLAHPDALSRSLVFASMRGHTSIVELLVDSGADIDAKCSVELQEGNGVGNALYFASFRGEISVVKALLRRGANPTTHGVQNRSVNGIRNRSLRGWVIRGPDGREPGSKEVQKCAVEVACQGGFETIVQLLLEHGAAVDNLVEDSGLDSFAAKNLATEELVRLLMKKYGPRRDSRSMLEAVKPPNDPRDSHPETPLGRTSLYDVDAIRAKARARALAPQRNRSNLVPSSSSDQDAD